MDKNGNGRVLVFSGRANPQLAKDICRYMNVELGRTVIKDFSDKEIYVKIEENVRGGDVFVIQSTCYPGNTNLMEMLIMIDALRRSSAKRITAVLPYYPEVRAARSHHVQAGGGPSANRGHRPGAHRRPARRADPGIF